MNQLYPIIRRKRRPLIVEDGAPPVVVPPAVAPVLAPGPAVEAAAPSAAVVSVGKPGRPAGRSPKGAG
jgi:hypothetical protein